MTNLIKNCYEVMGITTLISGSSMIGYTLGMGNPLSNLTNLEADKIPEYAAQFFSRIANSPWGHTMDHLFRHIDLHQPFEQHRYDLFTAAGLGLALGIFNVALRNLLKDRPMTRRVVASSLGIVTCWAAGNYLTQGKFNPLLIGDIALKCAVIVGPLELFFKCTKPIENKVIDFAKSYWNQNHVEQITAEENKEEELDPNQIERLDSEEELPTSSELNLEKTEKEEEKKEELKPEVEIKSMKEPPKEEEEPPTKMVEAPSNQEVAPKRSYSTEVVKGNIEMDKEKERAVVTRRTSSAGSKRSFNSEELLTEENAYQ